MECRLVRVLRPFGPSVDHFSAIQSKNCWRAMIIHDSTLKITSRTSIRLLNSL
jgi:hypothetical protein